MIAQSINPCLTFMLQTVQAAGNEAHLSHCMKSEHSRPDSTEQSCRSVVHYNKVTLEHVFKFSCHQYSDKHTATQHMLCLAIALLHCMHIKTAPFFSNHSFNYELMEF